MRGTTVPAAVKGKPGAFNRRKGIIDALRVRPISMDHAMAPGVVWWMRRQWLMFRPEAARLGPSSSLVAVVVGGTGGRVGHQATGPAR